MIGRIGVGLVGLGALLVPLGASAEPFKSCTNESWEGSYGYLETGTRIIDPAPGPRAAVGRMTADGHGNLAGNETKSEGGVTLNLTFTGSYTMLKDCTGSGSITLSNGEVRNFNFVIVEDGEQILFIQTDPGRTITITATKQKAR